ncbi:MAG: sulfite exporter TauE/SafE family protein [Thermoleophilia bacterium]
MTTILTTILAMVIILIAASVRGYSGFGFALIGVAGLSIISAPSVAIPTVLVLEIIVGLLLLPPVWREISWRPVLILLAGAIVLTPIGALFLIHVPTDLARIGIALAISAAALVLLFAAKPRAEPSTPTTVATGAVAGLLNGAFGISGPPIVLFFMSGDRAAGVSRASMMACFLVLDAVAVASFAIGGLVDRNVLTTVLLCLPVLALGSWLGHRAFHDSNTARFRTRVLWLLIALALITGMQGLLPLVH